MACKPVKFSDVTRDQFEAIRARIYAQAEEVTNAGDKGNASGYGFKVTWTFNEADRSLTFQCVDKPFYLTEGFVAGRIRDLVEADL
jgi:hypothetical protein